MKQIEEQTKIEALEKQNRILRKKLERIEAEQEKLEHINLAKESLLKKVIEELKESKICLEHKSTELEIALQNFQLQEESLRLIVEGTASHTGDEFFRHCVRFLAQVMKVKYAFITQIDDTGAKARVTALWTGEEFAENIEYDLADTPCAHVYEFGFAIFPNLLAQEFPNNCQMANLNAESFMGIAITNSKGNVIGTLGIMDTKPLKQYSPAQESILQIFAARVGAEIIRNQVELKLRQQAYDLETTIKELQFTQAQLIHSEKMSSLGQLVAGIAHEINNPVGFIHSNISPANQYIQDLLSLIQLYQQHYPNPVLPILKHIDNIELDFLIEDLPRIITSMEVGTERIRDIVLSLRNFSRLDEAELKPVNLHEGLDSTLMILEHRLKATTNNLGIKIIKEYGNLPLVECCCGQLNQVFMNILTNAIDALEENIQNNHSPQITIKTEVLNQRWVAIRIADNGAGMTEQTHAKLFDPFFTTKPVGKGTGMGMSISYKIITEKHGGKLSCNSSLGNGTEFIIEIPINVSTAV